MAVAVAGEITEEDRAKHRVAMQKHVEACKTHDALKQAVGAVLHATLTAPQRAERERTEPERRAERQRAAYMAASALFAASIIASVSSCRSIASAILSARSVGMGSPSIHGLQHRIQPSATATARKR